MAAQVYQSLANATYSATTTALLTYQDHLQQQPPPPALMPTMPAFNDSATAQRFYASLTGLLQDGAPAVPVPLHVDTRMLVTFGLGVMPCAPAQTLCNRTLGSVAASMNNVSFQFPTAMSLLEAHMRGAPDGVFTRDFPDRPPVMFDFTGDGTTANRSLMFTSKGTKVKTLRYNETVEVVLQNTAILGAENHPVHLHGFNFFVLAQGTGNFNNYNLVNPQQRNTVAVPAAGWAVIRFTANNPAGRLDHALPPGRASALRLGHGLRGGRRAHTRRRSPTAAARLPPVLVVLTAS
jgi:laccase